MTRRGDPPEGDPPERDPPGGDSQAAAAYIADLTGSLAVIARRHGLDTLGYILEMAREEADNTRRAGNGARRDQ